MFDDRRASCVIKRAEEVSMDVRFWTIVVVAAIGLSSTGRGDEPQGRPASKTVRHEQPPAGPGVFDVRRFGAVGDGLHLDTRAIQAAIDACAAAKGGIVFVPPGQYQSGTIFLKSNVTLHLAAAATILGSTNLSHYATGMLPAYGLYARHVKGLALEGVRFDLARPDLRPAVVCDDAEDVEISGLRAKGSREAESLIRLRATRDAFLHGCRPPGETGTFLRAEGPCRSIVLNGNDLHAARETFETAAGAARESVKALGEPRAGAK
jgi:hypothetical protein